MSEELISSCQYCNGHVEFPREYLGQTVACPHCSNQIVLTEHTKESSKPLRYVLMRNHLLTVGVAVILTWSIASWYWGFYVPKKKADRQSLMESLTLTQQPNPAPISDMPGPPEYIHKVVGGCAGIGGVRIWVIFHDAKDRETAAEGQITVSLWEKSYLPETNWMFQTQTFKITKADFKNSDYGLWNAFMLVLPRIKYQDGYVPKGNYGIAKVKYVGRDGRELEGLDNSLSLKP